MNPPVKTIDQLSLIADNKVAVSSLSLRMCFGSEVFFSLSYCSFILQWSNVGLKVTTLPIRLSGKVTSTAINKISHIGAMMSAIITKWETPSAPLQLSTGSAGTGRKNAAAANECRPVSTAANLCPSPPFAVALEDLKGQRCSKQLTDNRPIRDLLCSHTLCVHTRPCHL